MKCNLFIKITRSSEIRKHQLMCTFSFNRQIMGESTLHIFMGDWVDNVNYWRPAGILQCLPIFSMALFCQTQLFEIYETIPNVSLEKMNDVVRGALNICTLVYMCVGLFGYIAFCTQPFTGNSTELLYTLYFTINSFIINLFLSCYFIIALIVTLQEIFY